MRPSPFDTDILKDLREHTRTFIKLDLGYLAAAGTLITALKIGLGETLGTIAHYPEFANFFIFICVIDVAIYLLVFNDWLSASSDVGIRQSSKIIQWLLNIQPLLHLFFICSLILAPVYITIGGQQEFSRFEGIALFQENVESYISNKGIPPKSLEELTLNNPHIKLALKKLKGERIRFHTTAGKNYQITFAGQDNKFDTADDMDITHDLQIREILEQA